MNSHLTHDLASLLVKRYASIADLPKQQVEGMTTHEKHIFLAAWTSAFDQYNGDERRAFATAHAAVNRHREKNKIKKEREPERTEAGRYAYDGGVTYPPATTHVSPHAITGPNRAYDNAKTQAIVGAMVRDGWPGRPLLAHRTGGRWQALTGSHRIAAARQAGMDQVPVHELTHRALPPEGWQALGIAATDADRLAVLEHYRAPYPAVALMRHDVADKAARKFSPDQLRDDHGRFADDGGGATKPPVFSGVVDLRDGVVERTYTREQAARYDFHHNFILSPETLQAIREGDKAYFFVDKDGEVQTMQENELTPTIRAKIKRQISGLHRHLVLGLDDLLKYREDQLRDEQGRFAYEGGTPSRSSSDGEAGGATSTDRTEPPSTHPRPGSHTSETAKPSRSTTRATVSAATTEGGVRTRVGTAAKLVQPIDDVKELHRRAVEFHDRYAADVSAATQNLEGTRLVGSRVKSLDSAERKMQDFRRSAGTIADYVGARVGLDRLEHGDQVVGRLQDRGYKVLDDERFYDNPKPGGYRARHVTLMAPGGHVATELQLVPRELAEVQEDAHHFYESMRANHVPVAVREEASRRANGIFDRAWRMFQSRVRKVLRAIGHMVSSIGDLLKPAPKAGRS